MISFSSGNVKKKIKILCFYFEGFQIKWIYIIKLEKLSYVQYSYTRINNNQMQKVI